MRRRNHDLKGTSHNPTGRVVTAKHPNNVWHIDLTAVPTGLGFWLPWLPFAVTQQCPFCWWVGVVVDHFSRRVMRIAAFANHPTQQQFCAFLGRTIRRNGKPKYIVCDRDSILDCHAFRRWVKRKGIEPPRYGAVGKHGSIAVVERFILTLKQILHQLPLIPLRRDSFRHEVTAIAAWYNEHRPHMTLGGKTPNEVYDGRYPANRKPRIEPRSHGPRGAPCARPWALVGGKPGGRFQMTVTFQSKHRHLPFVMLTRAA